MEKLLRSCPFRLKEYVVNEDSEVVCMDYALQGRGLTLKRIFRMYSDFSF